MNSSLTIFDGGSNRLAADVTKQNVLATRQGLIALEQRVLGGAISAFMGVLEGRETVRLRENNYSVIEEELTAAKDRYEVGEITRTDVALAEARLASSASALSAAKGLLVQAEAVFKNAVGRCRKTCFRQKKCQLCQQQSRRHYLLLLLPILTLGNYNIK